MLCSAPHNSYWRWLLNGVAAMRSAAADKMRLVAKALPKKVYWCICAVFTFHLVALTWIFFRAQTLEGALAYLKGLFTWSISADAPPTIRYTSADILDFSWRILVLLMLVDLPQRLFGSHTALLRWPYLLRVVVLGVLVLAILMIRRYESAPFIYFQF